MRTSKHLLLVLILLSTVPSCNKRGKGSLDSYLIVVSFDGFRWDYAGRYDASNFHEMSQNGVHAERMIPVFPTKTFPNHYTMATGLYPDHHGIISNSFYAKDLGGLYRGGDPEMVNSPDAYEGEPIWATAEKEGVKAATYFWVGSEAPFQGRHPTYWKQYDENVPFRERVDEVIGWLEKPVEQQPGLVLLYFHEPDDTGHKMGPVSETTGEEVRYLDSILGYLRTRISALPQQRLVNLIVTSDHGMGPVTGQRYVNLYDHLREEWVDRLVGVNPFYLLDPIKGTEAMIRDAFRDVEGVTLLEKDSIPERLKYGANPRIPEFVLLADSLWSIGIKPKLPVDARGSHGYDPAFTDMHTIFYAEGPAFKKGYIQPVFPNVDLYGIMCRVLGLEPAENDGDPESVEGMFLPE